jgi:AcrR family transcriptional regulator
MASSVRQSGRRSTGAAKGGAPSRIEAPLGADASSSADAAAVAGNGSSDPQEREQTRRRILIAGVQVLREVGYGDFSVQKVARAAGVYQGNVTYYWPRRRDLVEALAIFAIEDYRATVFAEYAQLEVGAPGWATLLVEQVMHEAVREEKVRLLPELWSMGNAVPSVAAALGRVYEDAVELMIVTLGLAAEDPAAMPLRRELYLLGLAAEGLTAWFGNRPADDALLSTLRQEIVARFAPTLERLHAEAGDAASGPSRQGDADGVASVRPSTRRPGSNRASRGT